MHHPTPAQVAYMTAHASDDRRGWIIGVNTLCLLLAAGAVALRLVSRIKIGTKVGLDDGLVCAAWAMLFGHVVCLCITVQFGLGRHAVLVTDFRGFYLTSLVAQTFYNLCIQTIKFSILCLYGRIFAQTAAWFSHTLWLTALFIFMVMIPQCFVYIFQCVPIDSLWNDYGPGYRIVCINFQAAIVAFGIINIVTDWWILALPIPIVMALSLERRTKWSICSLFLVGGVVCVLSIIRLLYAKRFESGDPSWEFSTISTISTAECSLGILAACMPTWRPLFKFLRSTASGFLGSAGLKSGSKSEGKEYGTTTSIGRGRFFSRTQTPDIRSKINHNGMGTGMLGGRLNMASLKTTKGMAGIGAMGKRSETSMSSSSMEKILSGQKEMEMQPRGPSPAWQPGHKTISSVREAPAWVGGSTVSPTSPMPVLATAPASLLPSECEFRDGSRSRSPGGFDPAAEARAGEARWKATMKMERDMERARQRERSRSRSRVRTGSSESASGLEGILVQTEVVTSVEGKR